jgi:hypothetical protein
MSAEETLSAADAKLAPIGDLYRWSENFEHPGPWVLFLDLIGYTVENYGETLYNVKEHGTSQLGYLELDILADALKCYAVRPRDVEELVERLDRCE